MTPQDIQFIKDNLINFETVKLGYTRHLDHAILARYEQIYRSSLDPHFVLTYWCSSCVFDMLKRLMYHYEAAAQAAPPTMQMASETAAPEGQSVEEEKPKAKKATKKATKKTT